MEHYKTKQMIIDLEYFLSIEPGFLDQPEPFANPYTLNVMALGLRRRYYAQDNFCDLERASKLLEIAIDRSTVTSPIWFKSAHSLTKNYFLCYGKTSNLSYLERTIRLSEQLIEHTRWDSPDLPSLLRHLASYLMIRAKKTDNAGDLWRAYRAWRECITDVPIPLQDRDLHISRLIFCMVTYARHPDNMLDLAEVTDLMQLLVREYPTDTCRLPILIDIISDYIERSQN